MTETLRPDINGSDYAKDQAACRAPSLPNWRKAMHDEIDRLAREIARLISEQRKELARLRSDNADLTIGCARLRGDAYLYREVVAPILREHGCDLDGRHVPTALREFLSQLRKRVAELEAEHQKKLQEAFDRVKVLDSCGR